MIDASPTGKAIFKAVRASLMLVHNSSELLTPSLLLALKADLDDALAVIDGQVRAGQSGVFASL